MEIAFCWHYSRIKALKPQYLLYSQYAADVRWFFIRPRFRQIKTHYRRSSALYKLCVSHEPSDRVRERGGFHASDGHTVTFHFGENVTRVKCFDEECAEKCGSFQGNALQWKLPDDVVREAMAIFNEMRDSNV
jgi:hypothetical protein